MEIMMDIETLGNKAYCIAFEVGICYFDETGIFDSKKWLLNYKEAKRLGFRIDQSTVDWWKKQSRDIKPLLLHDTPLSVDLASIADWLKGRTRSNTKFWSKGAFDYPIMRIYFEKFNIPLPWKFWNTRDVRTALDVLKYTPPKGDIPHDALEDAILQVTHLNAARKKAMVTGL